MAQVETAASSRKITLKETGPCRYEVAAEFPPEHVKEQLDTRYEELKEAATLPGFRRGHAPRRLLEKRFGEDVAGEIKIALVREVLHEVQEKHELSLLGDPEVDLSKIALSDAAPCAFTVVVEVKPKIAFDDYKGVPATKPAAAVEDKDVEHALQHLREAKAELVVAPDGRVAEGDQVIADLKIAADGAEVQAQENAAFFVNSSIAVFGQPVPDLARALMGKSAGQSVSVPVAVPKEHGDPKLAGKTVDLALTITDVKRRVMPAADDAWAKEMGFDDLASLRARVKDRILEDKTADAARRTEEEILAELRRRAGIALPEKFLQTQSEHVLRRWAVDLYMQGVPEDEIQKRVTDQQAASKDAVGASIQNAFLIEHIAEKEKLYVTETEVEDRITQMASRSGRWPHEVKKYLESKDMLGDLRRRMREEKVRAFLVQNAKLA